MVNTRCYEAEYLYGQNESLAANNISENLFSQVDKEGNKLVSFDDILDHHVDETDTMHQGALII